MVIQKLIVTQLVKKFSAFNKTGSFTRSPPFLPTMSQIYPLLTIPTHTFKIYSILYSRLRLVFPSYLFPSGSRPKLYMQFCSPQLSVACPSHPIPLDSVTQIIFGEQYISLSISLCSFLQSPFTSSLLGPNVSLYTLFWNTLSLFFFFTFM